MALVNTSDGGDKTWRWAGCKFTPTDAELIGNCLLNKVRNLPLRIPPGFSIPEMEVYKKAPWELMVRSSYLPPGFSIPEMEVYKKAPWELMVRSSYLPTGVSYCFVRVPRSKASDNRLNRKTYCGSWVANGKPRDIPLRYRGAAIAGTRRSLKFFKDSDDPRKKNKKDSSLGLKWIMHEYRLDPSLYETIPSYATEEIILCRITDKRRGAANKSDGDSLPAKALPMADSQETPEPWMAEPYTHSMAIDVSTRAMKVVPWMAAAPAIQDATADVFGRYILEGPPAVPETWPCDDIFGFLDDLELAAEDTPTAATTVAPPSTEPWMAAPPKTQDDD